MGHADAAVNVVAPYVLTVLLAGPSRLVYLSSSMHRGGRADVMCLAGRGASDDLRLGPVTQVWLATSDDEAARSSGGYWYHLQRRKPDPHVHDVGFQDALLAALADVTGVALESAG